MSKVITVNNRQLPILGNGVSRGNSRANLNSRVLSMNEKKNKERKIFGPKNHQGISAIGTCLFLAICILLSGAFYLYQVNDLATKGYEMKEAETKITELEKASKKMEIREVELRSMYNIEKATKDLDLVNTQNVSYVEMNSPVAMR